ncbi:uncharacterized protein LOC113232620 [Hyposmocoma kahamanoa]|uniref:uncharacterized protein LOC113232620 n=1 Tax=Hyposmocoma kahamanoa TaxID=1477025 RepID=UPI000E6D6F25|nr:uncharacterized protein LOC113232620 [Hyposmocoma kahamanoa]
MNYFEKRKGKNLSNEKARKPSARVKNPCKICSETVNIKTGLQCKGACKKWAHFDCLKFSAKQVDDIQSGLLKISCPCPDCENDSKVNQSQHGKNREFRSRYNDCDTTFCPGIPQQKVSSKALCNLDAFNQTSKPLPYGITEGTSYEYFIRNETKQYDDKNVEEEDEYEEQVDEDTEEEDEDEEKSDIDGPQCKFHTVLLAQSSSQLTSTICCNKSRSSPGTEVNVASQQTTTKPGGGCCRSGTCSTSSSSSGKKTSSPKGKDKKGKEKNPKEKKPKEKKPKEKKGKEEKKTANKGKTDNLSPCCRSLATCCKSDNVSLGSKQSAESSNTSTSSTKSSKSTRSTQAPCGQAMQFCPGMEASSPTKLMKSEGVYSGNRQQPGDDRYNSPRAHMPTQRLPLSPNPYCPPMPRSTPQQQQTQYPIPPPYGTLLTTCRPGCQGMKPASRGPPNYPEPGSERGQLKVVQNKDFSSKGFGQGGLCLPECCDPNRARTVAISNISSTQLLSLSPSNRSKSFCTLDTSNKKEGTNISTEISAHTVKINKSDTKIWDQQQMNKYNRKMLLLALERMCQTMGQFSVQFRELTNKMTEKMDTKR